MNQAWLLALAVALSHGSMGIFAGLTTCTLLSAMAFSQAQAPVHPWEGVRGPQVEPGSAIKVDVDLTLVNVTVMDQLDRLVTGLEKENFQVFEDKSEQEVLTLSNEDMPVSIGLVLDMSGSMSNKVEKAREAAVQFMRTANPRDEFFLVTFNDRAQLTSGFTNRIEDMQSSMMFTKSRGRTALFDAIYLGLTQMKGAHNAKRALLVISDGGDNHSRYNETDIKNYLKESDCQLYAIGIYDPYGAGSRTSEELYGPSLLTEMTEMTGGHAFTVKKIGELPVIATKIGMELRNQYVLGYKSANPANDGLWRKIEVKLHVPESLTTTHVYARNGYYAPRQ
jgi:Ca-activated chloride channel family protein